MFARAEWPVIDVTRRSIEETAAAIMALLNQKRGIE
jgi:regulator of PEP synthase PpsR (kinase-PPPase family)